MTGYRATTDTGAEFEAAAARSPAAEFPPYTSRYEAERLTTVLKAARPALDAVLDAIDFHAAVPILRCSVTRPLSGVHTPDPAILKNPDTVIDRPAVTDREE